MIKIKIYSQPNPDCNEPGFRQPPIALYSAKCPLCEYSIPGAFLQTGVTVKRNMARHLAEDHRVFKDFVKFKCVVKKIKPERIRHLVSAGERVHICTHPDSRPRWFQMESLPLKFGGYKLCRKCIDTVNEWERL